MAGQERQSRAQVVQAWHKIFSRKPRAPRARNAEEREQSTPDPARRRQAQTRTSLRPTRIPGSDLVSFRKPFDVAPFRLAQDSGGGGTATYAQALQELRAGRKRSHWVWYVLPQLRGLSSSAIATFYGLRSAAEVRVYLYDEVLCARLREVLGVVLGSEERDVRLLMGSEVDAWKLQACVTVFLRAVGGDGEVVQGDQGGFRDEGGEEVRRLCRGVLDKYFDGEMHAQTERILDEAL